MAKGKKRTAAQPLIDLLNRLAEQSGSSFRLMAERAEVAPDTFARVARGDGLFSDAAARKLTAAYGAQEGFTLNDVRRWAYLPIPVGEEDPPPDADTDPLAALTPEVRVAFSAARAHLPPEDLAALQELIAHQMRTYTAAAVRRERGPTKYREGDE